MSKKIDIIEYDDEAQEVKVKYLGPISYKKIRDIDTTDAENSNQKN